MSLIANRSPANVTSLGKFLSVSGPVVREGLAYTQNTFQCLRAENSISYYTDR